MNDTAVYNNLTLLAEMVQANVDYIRTQMYQLMLETSVVGSSIVPRF